MSSADGRQLDQFSEETGFENKEYLPVGCGTLDYTTHMTASVRKENYIAIKQLDMKPKKSIMKPI